MKILGQIFIFVAVGGAHFLCPTIQGKLVVVGASVVAVAGTLMIVWGYFK
jgi:hypothetical protein